MGVLVRSGFQSRLYINAGIMTRSGGVAQGDAPQYLASEIGDIDRATLEVTFDRDIFSPGSNYALGVVIKKNTITQTINSATRQSNHAIVHYVLSTNGDTNDVFTWEYDDATGDIEAETGGADLEDVAAQSAVNYIGSHLYFDTEEDAVWLAMVA